MQRVWFNKTFSSVAQALRLIARDDHARHYQLICSNTHPHTVARLAAHEYALEPKGLTGADYVAWCLQFCREQRVDIFWPGKEAALISAARDEFAAQGTRVLAVGTADVLQLLHDKAAFYRQVNLPMAAPAEFYVADNLAQLDAGWDTLRARHARLCIKPASSVYGLGFAVIDEQRDSAQLLLQGAQYHIGWDDLRRGLAALDSFRTMILMQYLAGHEYSVDCLGEHGKLHVAIARKKPLHAGQGQSIQSHPAILAACEKLCADHALNGIFNVQFREHSVPDGDFAPAAISILEINPRMSGGIAMACLAGPNLPYLALRGFDAGYANITIPPVQSGLRVAEMAQAVVLP